MSQPSSCTIPPDHDGNADGEAVTVVLMLTPAQAEALAATRTRFTPEQIAEIKRRERESQKVLERLAATETLEEQQRLANEICPSFDDWIKGRNRVLSTPARRPRTVAAIVPRGARTQAAPRERRESSSSRSSGQDPGDDPDPEQDDRPWALGFVDRAPFLWRIRAVRCRLLELIAGVER
jgi:hypothetical protein